MTCEELSILLNEMDTKGRTDWISLKKDKFALVEKYRDLPEVYEFGKRWVLGQ